MPAFALQHIDHLVLRVAEGEGLPLYFDDLDGNTPELKGPAIAASP